MFLVEKTGIIIGTETTPYTAETLTSADYNLGVRDLTYSHEIAEYKRKILLHTLDQQRSVMGARTGKVGFKVDMYPAATPNAEPAWSKLLQACGYKAVGWNNNTVVDVSAAVDGISWFPHADMTHSPVSILIEELEEGTSPDGLRLGFSGMVGEVSFSIGTVGEPVQANFEFQGAWPLIQDFIYANRLVPTNVSDITPPSVMGATALVNSINQDFDSFEIVTGNDIQLWKAPQASGGVVGAYIAGRSSTISIDPNAKLLSQVGFYSDWIGQTLRAIQITLSSAPALSFNMNKAQYISVAPDARNGARTHKMNFLLTGSASETGNDSFEILQGART